MQTVVGRHDLTHFLELVGPVLKQPGDTAERGSVVPGIQRLAFAECALSFFFIEGYKQSMEQMWD